MSPKEDKKISLNVAALSDRKGVITLQGYYTDYSFVVNGVEYATDAEAYEAQLTDEE